MPKLLKFLTAFGINYLRYRGRGGVQIVNCAAKNFRQEFRQIYERESRGIILRDAFCFLRTYSGNAEFLMFPKRRQLFRDVFARFFT